MKTKIHLSSTRERWTLSLTAVALLVFFIFCVNQLNLETGKFFQRFWEAGTVIQRFFSLNFSDTTSILQELFTSICMAIAGLAIGFILSLIFSFLGASNTAPHKFCSVLIKSFIGIIRAVPALVWILIVVASLGFGNTAGVVGLVFPTTGYLTKSFMSSIEEQDPAILETMRSTGANWFQTITEGLLPGLVTPFLSWTSIRLESNIAESISLGMVGAGGIGMLLVKAIGKYDYPMISTIILFIFVTMITVELLIGRIKKSLR